MVTVRHQRAARVRRRTGDGSAVAAFHRLPMAPLSFKFVTFQALDCDHYAAAWMQYVPCHT
jgi:hypothetical protein